MAEFETAGGSPGSAPMAWPWGPLVRVMRDTLIPGRCCRRHPAEDEGNYHGNCGDFGVGWPKIHCFFMFFLRRWAYAGGLGLTWRTPGHFLSMRGHAQSSNGKRSWVYWTACEGLQYAGVLRVPSNGSLADCLPLVGFGVGVSPASRPQAMQ